MKRVVILMLVLLVGVDRARAIWIHMGSGGVVYQIERICQDGFTMSVAIQPAEFGMFTIYARPYPITLNPDPGSFFMDLYLNGTLPNEQYPQPAPPPVATGYVEILGSRANALNVVTPISNFWTSYYATGDVPWTNGFSPPFGSLPYLGFFTNGNAPMFIGVAKGSFAGIALIPSGIQNCYLFSPPNLTVPGTQNAVVGTPLTIPNIGQFSDSSYAFDGVNPVFNYTINWGDGTANSTGIATLDTIGTPSTSTLGSFDGMHTYANAGLYTVTVSVNDNDDGIATQTFQVIVFTPDPPGAKPVLNLMATNTPILTWNRITGATGYEVHISPIADFPLLLTSIRTVAGDVLSITTNPLTRGRRYYWRVRAKNAAGVWGNWSPVQMFIVDLQ